MGMESFRIDFIYESTTQKEIVDFLKTGFKVENNYFTARKFIVSKKVLIGNKYRIEDYIIAHFNDSEKTFSLEACFSNYDKYVLLFYRIFSFLKENFDIKIRLGKELLNESLDLPNIKILINGYYETKYKTFIRKYCINDVDMSPGESFYKNYKKIKQI